MVRYDHHLLLHIFAFKAQTARNVNAETQQNLINKHGDS